MPEPEFRRGGDQQIPRPSDWAPGGPPPWHGRDLASLEDATRVEGRVASFVLSDDARVARGSGPVRDAAVLVPVVAGAASLILTRRSQDLSRHRGEIAFPGGRLDAGESPIEAALRESTEEIALAREHVTVHGSLTPLVTVAGGDHITPVVATVATAAGCSVASPEVDRVFTVGLSELASSFRAERWRRDDREFEIHFYDLDGETLWGATARMVTELIDVLTRPG